MVIISIWLFMNYSFARECTTWEINTDPRPCVYCTETSRYFYCWPLVNSWCSESGLQNAVQECRDLINTWVVCDPAKIYRLPGWWTWCCPGVIDENWDCQAWLSDVGINISTDCLLNWQCNLNIYKVMWIRKSNENPTVMWFFQDITLASTTAILWTVITISIIISWLMFAISSITWKDTKRARQILIDSFIWLLLIVGSYTIIRLIQFIATAWS